MKPRAFIRCQFIRITDGNDLALDCPRLEGDPCHQRSERTKGELMRPLETLLCAATVLFVGLIARGQQGSADVPTFRVNSRLVFLDATVLDKKGHPVVEGLTKDDFTITEDGKPQDL